MNHADVRAKMADYLEGHLDLTDRALLDAHLDACSDCADDIGEMRSTIAVLRALPEPEVPGDFSANVMRRIRTGEAEPGFFDRVGSFFDDLMSPRVLAPASAALLSAGFVFWGQQVGLLDVGGAGLRAEPTASASASANANAKAERVLAEAAPASVLVSAPSPSPSLARARAGKAMAADDVQQQVAGFSAVAAMEQEERVAAVATPSPGFRVTVSFEAPPPYQIESKRRAPAVEVPFRSDWSEASAPRSVAVASTSARSLGDATARDAGRYGIAAEPKPADPRTRDDWLAILENNPGEFAQQLSKLTLAEQELWVDRLARHAAEQGSLERIVSRLRSAGGPVGEVLAEDFAAVGQDTGE